MLKDEFVEAADRHFGYLRKDLGYKRTVTPARDELVVAYTGAHASVRVEFENWAAPSGSPGAIVVFVVPLEAGKVPEPFDAGLHLRATKFALDDLAPFYDAYWLPPEKRRAVATAADADQVLAAYADVLRQHGGTALAGDASLFVRLTDAKRRRIIDEYTEKWSDFVDQVCGGHADSITDYVEGINTRDKLQTFLQRWEGNRAGDPNDRIRELDDRFLACTEPVAFHFGPPWQLLPMSTARDWWRKPKVLRSPLREYFAEREPPS